MMASVKALPTRELGKLVVKKGLNKILLKKVDSSNLAACEREIGRQLTPFIGQSFTASTATETITYKLDKKAARWTGKHVSLRDLFEEIKRTPKTTDNGVNLESEF